MLFKNVLNAHQDLLFDKKYRKDSKIGIFLMYLLFIQINMFMYFNIF